MVIGCFAFAASARAQHVAEGHDLAVGIGDLDADRALARDRREDAHLVRGDRVGEVLRERGDPLDLDARPELDLVLGHGGPAREARDLRVDLELVEHARDLPHDVVVRRRARLRRRARGEGRRGGQVVGPFGFGCRDARAAPLRRTRHPTRRRRPRRTRRARSSAPPSSPRSPVPPRGTSPVNRCSADSARSRSPSTSVPYAPAPPTPSMGDSKLPAAEPGTEHLGDAVDAARPRTPGPPRGSSRCGATTARARCARVSSPSASMPSSSVCAVLRPLRRDALLDGRRAAPRARARRTARRRGRGSGPGSGSAASS